MGVDEPGGAEIARPSGVFAYLVFRCQHHAISLSYSLTITELQTKKRGTTMRSPLLFSIFQALQEFFSCVGSSLRIAHLHPLYQPESISRSVYLHQHKLYHQPSSIGRFLLYSSSVVYLQPNNGSANGMRFSASFSGPCGITEGHSRRHRRLGIEIQR